jgi:hypothetical protein
MSMTSQPDSNPNENPYMIDHESAAEMARLLNQDHFFTKAMGGWLSERDNDFTDIHQVLDVGCGPGGWSQELVGQLPRPVAM